MNPRLISIEVFVELKDFDYPLPEDLIARYPLPERDSSRLMVLNRSTGAVTHRRFPDIKEYLNSGDLLMLNDTRVMPGRIIGKKATGGAIELLLVERAGQKAGAGREPWRCLAKPSRGLKRGVKLFFEGGISAEVDSAEKEGFFLVEFNKAVEEVLIKIGLVPIPPYLRREPEAVDSERYQTVFAENPGAVAAPTAGLHFTTALLDDIKAMGVNVEYLTLHTGPGTFLPVRESDLRKHRMMGEYFKITPEAFNAVRRAKAEDRRVVAVGSTVTRALETSVLKGAPVIEGPTDLFITPGFEFKAVDALVTNFHLPRSTLLMLVSAFAGHKFLMDAYKEAVVERYRFFSYGDAMLII